MRNFNAPRPRFRWLLGLLFAELPRRFIAGRFRDLAPSRPDEPVPDPIGQARPRQLGGLPNRSPHGLERDGYGGRSECRRCRRSFSMRKAYSLRITSKASNSPVPIPCYLCSRWATLLDTGDENR